MKKKALTSIILGAIIFNCGCNTIYDKIRYGPPSTLLERQMEKDLYKGLSEDW